MKENIYKPVVFYVNDSFSFKKAVSIFQNLTEEKNQIATSEDTRFFKVNKIFKIRAIIYRTNNFSKREFDTAKDQINKKANNVLNTSHLTHRSKAHKMMRFNIICTNELNDELYNFISQNANHNLTRVEGVINMAIIGDKIMIPPLYDKCDFATINRYKKTVKFINQVLLNF